MNIKSFALTALLAFTMVGCHKMSFVKKDVNPGVNQYSQFHINLILGLYEFSDAVELNKMCKDTSWATLKTEQDIVTGLISFLDTALVSVTGFSFDVWHFQNVEVICADK